MHDLERRQKREAEAEERKRARKAEHEAAANERAAQSRAQDAAHEQQLQARPTSGAIECRELVCTAILPSAAVRTTRARLLHQRSLTVLMQP